MSYDWDNNDPFKGLKDYYREQIAITKQRDELLAAIQAALNELGVPGPGYPAPVANAVEILKKAVGR